MYLLITTCELTYRSVQGMSQALRNINLLNKVCDRACNSKYRPKVKPTVVGFTKSRKTS